MRVLITGHDGYIGSLAVTMFTEAGHEVVGLDTNLYDGCDFKAPARNPGPRIIRKDIRDIAPFNPVTHYGDHDLRWHSSVET